MRYRALERALHSQYNNYCCSAGECRQHVKWIMVGSHHQYHRSVVELHGKRNQSKFGVRLNSSSGAMDGKLVPARLRDFLSLVWKESLSKRIVSSSNTATPIVTANTGGGSSTSDVSAAVEQQIAGRLDTAATTGKSVVPPPNVEARVPINSTVASSSLPSEQQVEPLSSPVYRIRSESPDDTGTADCSATSSDRTATSGSDGKDSSTNSFASATVDSVMELGRWIPTYFASVAFNLNMRRTDRTKASEVASAKLMPDRKVESLANSSLSTDSQTLQDMAASKPVSADSHSKPAAELDDAEEELSHTPVLVESISVPRFKKSFEWGCREVVEQRTRYLLRAVATSNSSSSRVFRLQELCGYLQGNPQAKSFAVKDRAIPLMLRLRGMSKDRMAQDYVSEALALLGYISPVSGRGIRILSIDGGGTRGIMAVEILRSLEELTKQPIHKLFDYICGVSTGSILVMLLGAMRASMDECEEMYKVTSKEIFSQSSWWGTGKLVLNHAYYDTEAWTNVLRKHIGEIPLIHTSRDPTCPKIAAISTAINQPRIQSFIFRNYDYPDRRQSHFPGSYTARLWEAVRASAAAPGYFEEFKLDDYVLQDGGVLTNNPAALTVHECRHLWPGEEIQCLVSLGTGRFEPQGPITSNYSSLKTKLLKILDSATDTEAVHTILNDLLPPSRYFRFNPYLTEMISLDEIRPEKFHQLQNDARMYIRKNEHKLVRAAEMLVEPRSQAKKTRDSLQLKLLTYL